MTYPISSDENGINIKPELMEKEKLYHFVFKDKVLLLFKDSQDFLNCYEIEEEELVNQVKNSETDEEVEKIFEKYIQRDDPKIK
ncbi:hypothetical protein [Nitrosarchaeum sp.]|jgi:hypothetical protein|uniref:hypothetical protein n=1 Tax=Nitrosarchaeum sp. TaxID=2026886 RepID=UPI00247C0499|nr:hypothetical protein [Nitrosarchaeum sp.]MCV0412243.1 hypothetical protein [Nitrosarchaeum sp.]